MISCIFTYYYEYAVLLPLILNINIVQYIILPFLNFSWKFYCFFFLLFFKTKTQLLYKQAALVLLHIDIS